MYSSILRCADTCAHSIFDGHVIVVRHAHTQAGYFVLEFYKDRIKKQSVKNFMLHNSRGQFIMQFGRSKEDNVFALDFTGPFSPLAAFGVALVSAA